MKEIRLSQGKVAIVDDADYLWLSQWKWSYSVNGYAVRGDYTGGHPGIMHKMHRDILGLEDARHGHHKNGERLDNRRNNLEALEGGAHTSHHMRSQKFQCHRNRFKGVTRTGGTWRCVYREGPGASFPTEEEAAYAYNLAALHAGDTDAYLNPVTKEMAIAARLAWQRAQEKERREQCEQQRKRRAKFNELLAIYSQVELARISGMHESTISLVRAGKRRIGKALWKALLAV